MNYEVGIVLSHVGFNFFSLPNQQNPYAPEYGVMCANANKSSDKVDSISSYHAFFAGEFTQRWREFTNVV